MIARKTAVLISAFAMAFPIATATVRADPAASKRESETSGVAPDKTGTSTGEANRNGTGEGRGTPAEKAPTTGSSPKN